MTLDNACRNNVKLLSISILRRQKNKYLVKFLHMTEWSSVTRFLPVYLHYILFPYDDYNSFTAAVVRSSSASIVEINLPDRV
jgi:hypothetical protein